MTEEARPVGISEAAVESLLSHIQTVGIDGIGRFKSASCVADEHLAQHKDVERAVDRIVRTHVRLSGATGFATGFGGLAFMPLTLPTDVTTFYVLATRCAGSIAHLRGYDLRSDEVRSVVLLSLIGSAGAGVVGQAGVTIGTKTAMASLRRLPGSTLIAINRAVGFRLLTKFGQKGAINLAKVVPVVGGGIGAGVNVAAMRAVGVYARRNFSSVAGDSPEPITS